ncbi:Putative ALA-interacting subunit 2 [Linum grandiflorum]
MISLNPRQAWSHVNARCPLCQLQESDDLALFHAPLLQDGLSHPELTKYMIRFSNLKIGRRMKGEMEVEGVNSSDDSVSVRSIPIQSGRRKAFQQFTQQTLPACKPVLTPAWVMTSFLLLGLAFVPVGFVTLRTSRSVVEIVERYDADCVPEAYKGNKMSYITDSSIPKNCSRLLKVHKYMKAPIYVYYQLDNYYQNHRRYVKSRSDKQLLHGLRTNDTSACSPEKSAGGRTIVPCGLIAWSLFNDTYTFSREESKLRVNRKNIAWSSDRDHKFGKDLSDQEDLIVWMRTAALPSFRKLYGRIEEDLDVDDVITVDLMNNYNTYSFGGKKKLVLSTSSWLGGRNDFMGFAFMFVGSSSIFLSMVFMLLHVKSPR